LLESSHHNCKIKITCGTDQDSSFYQECDPVFPEDGINKNVEKYWWRQRTQELMNDVSNFIEGGRNFDLQDVLAPLHPLGQSLEFPLAPPPSPLVRSQNIENADVMLDAASQEQWEVVWAILDRKPSLINKRPPLQRFSLIHMAAFQQNDEALANILERGVTTSILSEDLVSAKDIAEMNNYDSIVEAITEHETTESVMKRLPRLLSRVLNEFMVSIKKYMEENSLQEDPFMENLCDDIHVAIRSMSSRLGSMYLGARVLSQGAQRAYNLRDLTQMDLSDDDVFPEPPRLHHIMSQNPNSVYASPQTIDMMDALSSPAPARLQRQISVDTHIDAWEPQYT